MKEGRKPEYPEKTPGDELQKMLVYLRDGSAQKIVCAATLRYKLQIQLSISPSHSILMAGQPVPALTL